jgi:hypothetical protein
MPRTISDYQDCVSCERRQYCKYAEKTMKVISEFYANQDYVKFADNVIEVEKVIRIKCKFYVSKDKPRIELPLNEGRK